MEDIYGLLSTHLTIGDVCRLSGTCHVLRNTMLADHEVWCGMHKRIGLCPVTRVGHPQTYENLVKRILNALRCRQCGKTTTGRALLPTGGRIPLCGTCSTSGYARLMSRHDVHTAIYYNGFHTKKRKLPWSVFPKLTVAKRSFRRGDLYWRSEVNRYLNQNSTHTPRCVI